MNGSIRTDMLRANTIPQSSNMLSMGNPPFVQNTAQITQQQLGPNPMAVPSNINTNPPMGMLPQSNMPTANNPNHRMFAPQQTQQVLTQQQTHQQQMFMRQPQVPQQMNPANSPAGSRMAAMNSNHQLQGMGFPASMVNQQQQPGPNTHVRRVPSQSSLTTAAHLGNMSGVVTGGMSMGMNPQPNIHSQTGHMRQAHQQSQPMRSIQQPQMKGVPPDMSMGMGRQGGNHVIPPSMAGIGSAQAQVMNSLTQPASMGQASHPMGMPQSHIQNSFTNGVPVQSQPLLSSSPRPGSLPPSHSANMSLGTPGPSHTPVNRTRMTPDNANSLGFMNYPGSQFAPSGSAAQRIPSTSGQYHFAPSSTPPMSDIQQTPNPQGMINAQSNPQPHSPFHLTPAQKFEQMNNASNNTNNPPVEFNPSHYPMPPPSAPPRPPSHSNAHNPMATLPLQQHTPQLNPQQTLQQQPQNQSQPSTHSSHPSASHHPSPLHSVPSSEQLSMPPPRPQSRPRSQPQSQLPPQAPAALTPRSTQPPLPPGPGLVASGRLPLAQQQANAAAASSTPLQQVHMQQQANNQQPQHPPIASRPPQAPTAVPMPPNAGAVPQNLSDTAGVAGMQIPRTQQAINNALGSGQGLIRLLQFSGVLASESKTKLQLSWWNDLVKEYFTPKAVMKFTLWKDNQKNEAKPFEIGLPILPRFFLVTTQSGVKSMTLSLDGARERMYATGHAIVECVAAVWTYKYYNGYTVTLRGPLTAHVVVTSTAPPNSQPSNHVASPYMLKFEEFQFDATHHDKYISLEAITGTRMIESPKTPRQRHVPTPTPGGVNAQQQQQQRDEERKWEEPRVIIERALMPGEPVNAFGIPQATMRCLELAESVGAMADLITFANETKLGPLDALTKFATKIRDGQSNANPGHAPMVNGMTSNVLSHSFQPFTNQNGIASSPAVTLYSSAPTSVTNPPPAQSAPPPSVNSPQNTSSASSSPQKQHKTIPQPAASTNSSQASGAAASPSVSSGATSNTPALSNASLKRKQTSDTASPTISAPEQPPTKRTTRKRGRTTGAG